VEVQQWWATNERTLPTEVQAKFHPILSKISVQRLLESLEFSDFNISGPVHKCIINARCPKLSEIDLSHFQKSVISSVIHFINTGGIMKPSLQKFSMFRALPWNRISSDFLFPVNLRTFISLLEIPSSRFTSASSPPGTIPGSSTKKC
jgi:hypothetical protein